MGAVIAANLLCSATYGMKENNKIENDSKIENNEQKFSDGDDNEVYGPCKRAGDSKERSNEEKLLDCAENSDFQKPSIVFNSDEYLTVKYGTDKCITKLLESEPRMKTLKWIHVENCILVEKKTVNRLVECCKNLVRFDMISCTTTFYALKTIVKCYQNLLVIWLIKMDIPNQVAVAIAHSCKYLSSFYAIETEIDDIGFIEIAKHCKELKRIHVSHSKATDNTLIAFSECTSLTIVDAGSCNKIKGPGVSALMKNCSNITYLNVWYNDLSEQAVIDIGTYGRNVKTLYLDHSDGVTNKSILALAGSVSLQDLSLQDCWQVSNEGVINVIKNCPITRLNLCLCRKIDDTVIAALAEKNQIEDLNIYYCKKVTKEAVKMLTNCSKLKHIRVSCSGIDDEESIKRLKEAGIEIKK